MSLRRLRHGLSLLALLLSPAALSAETWDDYSLNDEFRTHVAVWEQQQRSLFTQWTTVPGANGKSYIIWGGPPSNPANDVEEMEVRRGCSIGDHTWVYLNSLGTRQQRYHLHTTRAYYVGPSKTYDITHNGCGTNGHPYALYDIPGRPYVIKVWGWIATAGGRKSRNFYWQQEVLPNQQISNPCWKRDEDRTRKALRLREAWWDQWSGWTIGDGDIDAKGQPTGAGVVYGRERVFAKDIGRLWYYTHYKTGDKACLLTSWPEANSSLWQVN